MSSDGLQTALLFYILLKNIFGMLAGIRDNKYPFGSVGSNEMFKTNNI